MASGLRGAGMEDVTGHVEVPDIEAESAIIQHQQTVGQTVLGQAGSQGDAVHTHTAVVVTWLSPFFFFFFIFFFFS